MDKPLYIKNEWERLINEKTFKSVEERNIFFEKLNKEPLTHVNKQSLTAVEYAKCLALIAYELSPEEGIKYANKALTADPECIEAYSFLGGVEADNKKRLLLYQKGIAIGKKLFSPEYFKENRGFFYSLSETIPFMNCLHFYGGTLAEMGRYKEAITIYEKILTLNILDNMSVRHQLMIALIHTNNIKKYKLYDERYIDDDMDWMLFNRALFSFKTYGENEVSNDLLKKAMEKNKHIVPVLISFTPENRVPDMKNAKLIGAVIYDSLAKNTWNETQGAIAWLRRNNP